MAFCQLVFKIMNAGCTMNKGGVLHQFLMQCNVGFDARDPISDSAMRMRAIA